MGPWQHVTTGTGVNISALELEWFDTWLLGEKTPLSTTTTPLHLEVENSGSPSEWVDQAQWPLPDATPTAYYFAAGRNGSDPVSDNDGNLTTAAPVGATGADTIACTGVSSPCDIQTDQWGAGALALGFQSIDSSDPCDYDDVTLGYGPGALTYTTKPFSYPIVVAGPIDATVYMTSARPTASWRPRWRRCRPAATACLCRRGRCSDRSGRSTGRRRGRLEQAAAAPGAPADGRLAEAGRSGHDDENDIQIFPTMAELPTGWRAGHADHVADAAPGAEPDDLPSLAAGVYQVQRNQGAASALNVPLAPASDFASSPCGSICSAADGPEARQALPTPGPARPPVRWAVPAEPAESDRPAPGPASSDGAISLEEIEDAVVDGDCRCRRGRGRPGRR